ncbi:TRAP-type C4-dicarboxylate transport system substrate-binding protein [Neobacillus niacini]|uniref:TRAP transporter substrate-binding protein n=1 Tax=Neobacillus niacini TaxID=86668 RepID=UPI002855CEA9|nr:TRAP transporter substrate-binding protein [Neobacillus niacini]MDR7078417.1 TRAP-type C4-dicarboxylate transport system substrate-binding protein [Neobacillus niacini]
MKKLTELFRPTNLLVIITLIVFPIIPMTFIKALNLKFAEPDTLAYFGSILGGILTLVGVSLTIRHSDNSYRKAFDKSLENEFIQSFPQKIEAINNVKIESANFFSEFKSIIGPMLEQPEVGGIKHETLKELKNTYSNKLLPVAAKLDGHVYVEVIHYLEEINHFNNFILDKDRYIQRNSLDMYKEEFKVKYAHACLKISRSIEFFNDYQESIGDYFTNITKDKNFWKPNPMLSQQQRERRLYEKLFQGVGQSKREKLKITVAHNQTSLENPYQLGMLKLKEEVEKASKDMLQVEIHPGTLGTGEVELLTKLKNGAIDVVVVAPNVVSRTGINELDLLTLPYLFDSYEHWERAVDGKVGRYISSLIKRKSKNSFHVLGYLSAGVRHYYGKKPIVGLEDLKGMTVRTQTSGVAAEYLTKIGAITTSMAWGEIYQGLQQKTIDFAENAYPYFVEQNHHKTDNGKYITETGHDFTTRLLLMNGKKYTALSRQQKKVLMEAVKAAVEEERQALFEQEALYKEIALQDGAEIYQIDPLPFKQIVEPIQQMLAKDIESENLLEMIKELKHIS